MKFLVSPIITLDKNHTVSLVFHSPHKVTWSSGKRIISPHKDVISSWSLVSALSLIRAAWTLNCVRDSIEYSL